MEFGQENAQVAVTQSLPELKISDFENLAELKVVTLHSSWLPQLCRAACTVSTNQFTRGPAW